MKSYIFGSNLLQHFEMLSDVCLMKNEGPASLGVCSIVQNNVLKSSEVEPDTFKFFNKIEKEIKQMDKVDYYVGNTTSKNDFFKQKWFPEYQMPATLGSWCVSLEGEITNKDQILSMLTTPASIPKSQIWFPNLIASTLSVFKINSTKTEDINSNVTTLLDFLQGKFVFSGFDLTTNRCYLYTSGIPMFYNKKTFGPFKFRYWKELDDKTLYWCKSSSSGSFKKIKYKQNLQK